MKTIIILFALATWTGRVVETCSFLPSPQAGLCRAHRGLR